MSVKEKSNKQQATNNITRLMLFVVCCLLFARPSSVLAYDEQVAHRLLSQVTLTDWQQSADVIVKQADNDRLVDGSQNEDNPDYRSLNHFYEPSAGRGLTVLGITLGKSALIWTSPAGGQNNWWGGDFSWATGVEALKNNHDDLAWTTLGHNLHLLADMASPAHVHNDDHAEGDNYEIYIKNYLSNHKDEAINKETVDCRNIDECLKAMADYTAGRAMSKDWSSLENLPAEVIMTGDGKIIVAGKLIGKYDPLSDKVILDSEVYDAYWQDLAPLVVGYGQSLINDYWQEAGRGDIVGAPAVNGNDEIVTAKRAGTSPAPTNNINKAIVGTGLAPVRVNGDNRIDNDIVGAPLAGALVNGNQGFIADESINIPPEYLIKSWLPIVSGGQSTGSVLGSSIKQTIVEAPPTAESVESVEIPMATSTEITIKPVETPLTVSSTEPIETETAQTTNQDADNRPPTTENRSWPENLLAYWSFDECEGDVANEPVKHNDLSIYSPWDSAGRLGCAIKQNGANNQATGRILKAPLTESEITLSFFWRDASDWPVGYAFNKLVLVNAEQRYMAGLAPSVHGVYYWYDDQEHQLPLAMPGDHDWHHLAGVFTTAAFKFYLDGNLVATVAGDYSLPAPVVKFYLNGEISTAAFDELAWWRGELNGEEIKSLADGKKIGY